MAAKVPCRHERADPPRASGRGRPRRAAVVLHHGRGADEHDLLGFGDVLDPARRLHVVTPRAPLTAARLAGDDDTWSACRLSDPDTLLAAVARLADFHDELWERTGVGGGRPCWVASRWARDELCARPGRRSPGAGRISAMSAWFRPSKAGDPSRPAASTCAPSSPMVATTRSWTSRSRAPRATYSRPVGRRPYHESTRPTHRSGARPGRRRLGRRDAGPGLAPRLSARARRPAMRAAVRERRVETAGPEHREHLARGCANARKSLRASREACVLHCYQRARDGVSPRRTEDEHALGTAGRGRKQPGASA